MKTSCVIPICLLSFKKAHIQPRAIHTFLSSFLAIIVVFVLSSCSHHDVQPNWVTYTESDGLANNYVNVIECDSENNIWFAGGAGGVSKFNGSTWTTYNSEDGCTERKINDLVVKSPGEVWLGTEWEGVINFDNNQFRNLGISSYVRALDVDDNGGIWFANSSYVHYYDGINTRDFNLGKVAGVVDDVDAIYIDTNGLVWIGTDLSGIFSFDGQVWQEYQLSEYKSSYIDDITEDHSGKLWAVSYLNGVFRLDGDKWTSVYADPSLGYRDIAIDWNNKVWVATTENVIMFDGSKWHTFTTADGLVNDNAMCITVDNENNVWIGTLKGVSKYLQTK